MLPASLEMHYAHSNPIAAEMLYHANQSWTIFNDIVDRLMGYLRQYLEDKKWNVDMDLARRYFIATVSMTSGFISEYHLTDHDVPVRTNMKFLLSYISAVVRIPLVDSEAVLDDICAILETKANILDDITF
ncbi:MAG: hypothetical protein MJZ38_05780 [archaeon]|nr:hypothetical protein [archaeon]